MNLIHPEVEWQPARQYECFSKSPNGSAVTTSIDVLNVHSAKGGEAVLTWRDNLGDKDMSEIISGQDGEKPNLTIFFLKSREDDMRHASLKGVQVSHQMFEALQRHYKLSSVYISWVSSPRFTPSYTTHFIERDESGRKMSLHGFYFYRSMMLGKQMCIYYIYNLLNQSTTYFIAHCPELLIRMFRQSEELNTEIRYEPSMLLRPFSLDVFIAHYIVWSDMIKFGNRSGMILQMEKIYGFTSIEKESDDTSKSLQKIHDEARMLTNAITMLTEYDYQIKYFKKMVALLQQLTQTHIQPSEQARNDESVVESLEHIECRIRIALNWLRNFQKRLDIRINLAFNLRAQEDSQTNLKIAKLTTDIAVDAQRDSSSMITIAAVTMFFLPGTFVCAVFSMVFFNDSIDSNGNEDSRYRKNGGTS